MRLRLRANASSSEVKESVVSFDEKRYFGKIHAAALGKGLQGIENAPTVEACGKSLYSDASGRMYTAASAGMGRLSASVVIAASLTARM